MKKYKKQFWVLMICIVCSFSIPFRVVAQPAGGDATDVDAPIDGGVSLLVAAGIGYGIKKVRDSRKKKSVEVV